jgi:hypothetical protein
VFGLTVNGMLCAITQKERKPSGVSFDLPRLLSRFRAAIVSPSSRPGSAGPKTQVLSTPCCWFTQSRHRRQWEIEKWVDVRLTVGFGVALVGGAVAVAGAPLSCRM